MLFLFLCKCSGLALWLAECNLIPTHWRTHAHTHTHTHTHTRIWQQYDSLEFRTQDDMGVPWPRILVLDLSLQSSWFSPRPVYVPANQYISQCLCLYPVSIITSMIHNHSSTTDAAWPQRFTASLKKHVHTQLPACSHSVQKLLSSTVLSKNVKIKIYGTVTLPVVLYGCETWSLTLRQGRRLRVFENRVLRRIFGPKGDEARGEWRKVHNEEL